MMHHYWMNPSVTLRACGLVVLGLLLSTAARSEEPSDDDKRAKPTAHVERTIEGWTVKVDQRLIEGDDAELGERAMALLARRLADIRLILPSDKVARLQEVTLWLDRSHGKLTAAQYHPSAGWLKQNGYSEQLAKCVHIPAAGEFSSKRHQQVQPWSVLHELAHAYHDQVLGFDHEELIATWQRVKESGRLEKVLHIDGHETRHYALTNQMEFFAEMSESYLGTNDFFPFNRAELKQSEPEVHTLLKSIWEQ